MAMHTSSKSRQWRKPARLVELFATIIERKKIYERMQVMGLKLPREKVRRTNHTELAILIQKL